MSAAPRDIHEFERQAEASSAGPIARAMRKVRASARRRLVVERGAVLLATGVLVILGTAVLDYLLRLPMAFRVTLWAVGFLTGGWAAVRALLPAWRFRPNLVEVALRVEHSDQAAQAGLRGKLASALELAMSRTGAESEEMRAAAVDEAIRRFGSMDASGATLLTTARAQRGLSAMAISLAPVLAFFLLAPEYARIGIARVLTPWVDAAWPKRTMVRSETGAMAHPLDAPLTLRAAVTRSNRPKGRTDVTVVYRVVVDGKAGPETKLLLNAAKGAEGESLDIYEASLARDAIRLAAGLSSDVTAAPDVLTRVLEFSFKTGDDETPVERVILVPRPRLVEVITLVTPPAYAAESPVVTRGGATLAMDGEHHGAVGPVLAGSRVELKLRLSKPVPTPGVAESPVPVDRAMPNESEWSAMTFGRSQLPTGVTWHRKPDEWRLAWTATENTSLSVRPVDAFDIAATDDAVINVAVAPDLKPSAVVVGPEQDEAVLATAVIPAAGEGRDDVGLSSVALDIQRHKPPEGSAGAPPVPDGELNTLVKIDNPPAPLKTASGVAAPPSARVQADLNLGEMSLSPGDEVWLTAVAVDGFDLGGEKHEPVRSTPRKLRIISEAQLAEQILDELAALKSVTERIDKDQSGIADRTREASAPGENRSKARDIAREQRGVSERLRPAQELLERAAKRAERNALSDQALRSLLQDAEQLVENAAQSAEDAAAQVDRIADTPADRPAMEASETARREQDRVRDDMAKLNDLLSRGRDGWAARQSVDRLLSEQRELAEQTRRAGQDTQGRTAEELTGEQRRELERLASAQEDLARKARQAAEDLMERAARVKPTDPAQAEAMERAAQQAMREQLNETMRDAAQQARQNQTGQAQQNQEQAAKTLEQMLEQLDKAQQRRDEALQRVLANLIASLEGLITKQEAEIAALAKAIGAEEPGGFDVLAKAMVSLHGQTLALAESTEAREAAEIVKRLDAAANHQSTAAANLTDPPDAAVADENERMSLKRLEEARDLAKEKSEQANERDQARKRNELRAAYAKILESQEKLREDTRPLVGKDLDRRERNTVKTLGERQMAIRNELTELRDKTEGLSQTMMFDYAHKRLAESTGGAAQSLSDGQAPARVGRQQDESVQVLKSLISSLKQGEPPKNNFRQQQAGGQQRQGDAGNQQQEQQGLIPPVAELLVLKEMQIEAARRTRETARAPDAEEVEAIGKLQRDLADLGKKVVEVIKNQGRPALPKPDGAPPEKPEGVREGQPGGAGGGS